MFYCCELMLGLGSYYYSYHLTRFLVKPSMLLYSINGCPVESNEKLNITLSLYVCMPSYACHDLLVVCLVSLVLHHISFIYCISFRYAR
jgi:hypothetical protein